MDLLQIVHPVNVMRVNRVKRERIERIERREIIKKSVDRDNREIREE